LSEVFLGYPEVYHVDLAVAVYVIVWHALVQRVANLSLVIYAISDSTITCPFEDGFVVIGRV
jgi:hypothetical protein